MTPPAVLPGGRLAAGGFRKSFHRIVFPRGTAPAFPRLARRSAGMDPHPFPHPFPMSFASRSTFALALACAAVPAAARAQGPVITPLTLEIRGGIANPESAFSDDTDADGGYSTEVGFTLHVLPFVGVYGAYQRAEFDRAAGAEGSVVRDHGWAAGVRVGVPTPFIPIDPWIRAGVVLHDVDAGALEEGGGRGVGMEFGGGLSFPLTGRARLTPGVMWTRYRLDDETVADGHADIRYLRAEVGVRLGL
jgi:hypothetical protein